MQSWKKSQLQLNPGEGFWSLVKEKQSRSHWKHHPVAQPFAWQSTKPHLELEDATKTQQQLKIHPQIWIWKAEQPKISKASKLSPGILHIETWTSLWDGWVHPELQGWFNSCSVCLFCSTCCPETKNLYKCPFDKAGENLCGLEQNLFQLWGNFSWGQLIVSVNILFPPFS